MELTMLHNHYFVEVLLREQQEKILNQSKLHHQITILNINHREEEGLKYIFRRIQSLLSPRENDMQTVVPISECNSIPDCQAC